MPTVHDQVRIGRPALPEAVVELVSLLTSDDWARYSTAGDDRCYYVVGHQASEADREGREQFPVLSLPLPLQVTPGHEAEVHARVAAERPAFVERASRRLQAAGVNRAHVSLLLDVLGGKKVEPIELEGKFAFEKGSEQWKVFGDLLSAVLFERGLDEDEPRSEAEVRHEVSVATQKHYAQELARLFPKVVQRAGTLEALDAVDPQLNEASRCYLYGFFRATVLLGAGALEGCLKAATGDGESATPGDSRGMYRRLVERATMAGVLGSRPPMGHDPAFPDYAIEVFKKRNKVAHEGLDPGRDDALEVLTKSRQVVEFVLNQRKK